MIVRVERESLLLITQPDHAGLSAEIMRAWKADGFASRPSWETVLLATREHDNGWREVDDCPEIDPRTGLPYDFQNAPTRIKQPIWPRGVARIADQSAYAGALIAQHALTVLRHYRDRPEWRDFFQSIARSREQLLERAGMDAVNRAECVDRDYKQVYLGDLLSLIFCNGWSDQRTQHGYNVHLLGATLTMTPDPFAGAEVPLSVRTRRIERRRYASDAVLRETLTRAPVEVLTGTALGRSPDSRHAQD
jgi:hypothetical protein